MRRSTCECLLATLVMGLTTPAGHAQLAAICDLVPEASDYTLVYALPIPANADYNNGFPPYSIDNTASIEFFDRIAYCL